MNANTPVPPPPGVPTPPPGQSFIQKTWVIVVALVFCFPVGLVFLWLHPAWSTKAKAIISGIVAVLVIPALFLGGGDDGDADDSKKDDEEASQEADPTEDAVEPLDYSIEELEDIDGNRLSARVVVSGKPTAEEVRETALAVMKEVRDSQTYSGLAVFLYDREEYIKGAFTLGKLEDAPDGEWGNAFQAPAGEYDDNRWTVEAYDKPWGEAPTAEQATLAATWDAIYTELEEDVTDEQWADPNFDAADLEAEATREAAQQHSVEPDVVDDANLAVLGWTQAGDAHTYEQ